MKTNQTGEQTMKDLNLYGYHFFDVNIKTLELTYSDIDDKLRSYCDMMEDENWVDDLKDAKHIFAEFALEMRRNSYQIDKVISNLKKMAEDRLNSDNGFTKKSEKINTVNNYEVSMQYAKTE